MAVKGQPICHWCRENLVRSSFGTTMPGIEYPGVYVAVCGPTCEARPANAMCVTRSFGQLAEVK